MVKTSAGHAEAQPRHAFLEGFVQQFLSEWGSAVESGAAVDIGVHQSGVRKQA